MLGWTGWSGMGWIDMDGLHARKAIVWGELVADITFAFLDKRSAFFNDSYSALSNFIRLATNRIRSLLIMPPLSGFPVIAFMTFAPDPSTLFAAN